MKKKSLVCFLLVLAVLLAGSAILWYTRPMTIQQLCPEMDLTQCSSITVYYEVVPSAEQERIVLEPDSPAFQAIMKALQDRTFSRSLTSLLPHSTQTVRVADGEFYWTLLLEFYDFVVLPDGYSYGREYLRLNNFFGHLSLDYNAHHTWDVTTEDQEAWVSQVMDIVTSAMS